MKTKIFLPVFAVIAALAIAITMSAFRTATEATHSSNAIKSAGAVPWYFNGIAGEEGNPAKYQTSPVSGVNCGGNGLLCSIMDIPSSNPSQPALSHGSPIPSNEDYELYEPNNRR